MHHNIQVAKNAINSLGIVPKPTFQQAHVGDLSGKTALVTGGTLGIGWEVAKVLALSGARVILVSRKAEHGEEAMAKIREVAAAEGKPVDVHFVALDLGSLADVRQVADDISRTEPRLDIFVGDAGIGVNAFALSADGIDRHMAVNYFGYVLLVNRLLPLLRRTATLPDAPRPRIVLVSSELHRTAPASVQFASTREVYTNDEGLGPNQLYARPKLALILFVKYGLVPRVLGPAGDRILAVTTHPGAVHTDQQDQYKEAHGKLLGTLQKALVVPFMRAPDQGSLSTLYAATAEDVGQGQYFHDPGECGTESPQACDEALAGRLWELTHRVIEEKAGKDALLPWDEGKKASAEP